MWVYGRHTEFRAANSEFRIPNYWRPAGAVKHRRQRALHGFPLRVRPESLALPPAVSEFRTPNSEFVLEPESLPRQRFQPACEYEILRRRTEGRQGVGFSSPARRRGAEVDAQIAGGDGPGA